MITLKAHFDSRKHKDVRTVDLDGAGTLHEVLKRASKVLRGANYSTPETIQRFPRNLDAFIEYVEDWIVTNLGSSLAVKFDGVESLLKENPVAYLAIISAIHSAECNILEDRLLAGNLNVLDDLSKLAILVG